MDESPRRPVTAGPDAGDGRARKPRHHGSGVRLATDTSITNASADRRPGDRRHAERAKTLGSRAMMHAGGGIFRPSAGSVPDRRPPRTLDAATYPVFLARPEGSKTGRLAHRAGPPVRKHGGPDISGTPLRGDVPRKSGPAFRTGAGLKNPQNHIKRFKWLIWRLRIASSKRSICNFGFFPPRPVLNFPRAVFPATPGRTPA